eukprot:gene16407-18611_t
MKERIAQDLRALEGADVGLFVKFNLLRSCINALPGFLTRACEPSENFQSFVDSVDDMVDVFINKLLGTPVSTLERERLRYLRELPKRFGGLGIARHSSWKGEKARLLSRHLVRHHIWNHYKYHEAIENSM